MIMKRLTFTDVAFIEGFLGKRGTRFIVQDNITFTTERDGDLTMVVPEPKRTATIKYLNDKGYKVTRCTDIVTGRWLFIISN